jgi:hypothetical protein
LFLPWWSVLLPLLHAAPCSYVVEPLSSPTMHVCSPVVVPC